MKLLGREEEYFLKVIIEQCNKLQTNHVELGEEDFPLASDYDGMYGQIVKSLRLKGYLGEGSRGNVLGGIEAHLMSDGKEYFNDKIRLEKQDMKSKAVTYNIGSITTSQSNVIIGDVTNSSLSLENSIKNIEQRIAQCPREEQQELKDLLEEATEIISNIEETRQITRRGSFIKRLGNHMEKHSWFYSEIVNLIGTGVMKMFLG